MITPLRNLWDNFRGSGPAALTVPPMDGAFRPNMAIETAAVVAASGEPDNIAAAGDAVFFSSGGQLLRLAVGGRAEVVETYAEPITAMAGAADGTLAVARRSKGISFVGGTRASLKSPAVDCGQGDVTAMAFVAEDTLAVVVGSEVNSAEAWREDLMQLRRAGSVWLCDLASARARKLAGDLGYPYGVVGDGGGRLVISEAWQTRLVRIDGGGGLNTVVDNLPAYPCRLAPAAGGGYWLALFAPRNQLVEFVLRETGYRERMMREIARDYWVSPSLTPPESALSPMQEGGVKIGGAIKPWAPSLSYGLIAKLDRSFEPDYSLHSRASGRRHGVTSVVEFGKRLLATSKGAGVVVDIALQ